MDDTIKPYYGNKIIILIFILLEHIFFGFILSSSFAKDFLYFCLTFETSKDEKVMQKIVLFFNTVNPVSFIIFVLIIIGFIGSITSLFILLIKDDCNIRFAKLNELKDLRTEVKSFEKKLNIKTKVRETKETKETNEANNASIKTKEVTHTNYYYEFYKKYMDTLAEI